MFFVFHYNYLCLTNFAFSFKVDDTLMIPYLRDYDKCMIYLNMQDNNKYLLGFQSIHFSKEQSENSLSLLPGHL